MSDFPDLGREVLVSCPTCANSGWVWPPNDDGSTTCPECGGRGVVKTWPDATPAQIQTAVNWAHRQMLEWKERLADT